MRIGWIAIGLLFASRAIATGNASDNEPPIPASSSGPTTQYALDASKLEECTPEWVRKIRALATYRDYLDEERPAGWAPAGSGDWAGTDEPIEYGKFALVEALEPRPRWNVAVSTAIVANNEYGAVALYICWNGPCGDPSQGYAWIHHLRKQHGNNGVPALEAAFFSCIRDEPSHRKRPLLSSRRLFGAGSTERVNMHEELAKLLQERSQPFMRGQWERLSRFTKNPVVTSIAKAELKKLDSDQS